MFETTNQINIINDVSWNHLASKARPALDFFFGSRGMDSANGTDNMDAASPSSRTATFQHQGCRTHGIIALGHKLMIWVRLKMGYTKMIYSNHVSYENMKQCSYSI